MAALFTSRSPLLLVAAASGFWLAPAFAQDATETTGRAEQESTAAGGERRAAAEGVVPAGQEARGGRARGERSASASGDEEEAPAPHPRLERFAAHRAMAEQPLLADHAWQFVGPTRMVGRCTDVVVHEAAPATVFLATAAGGVWKSTDDGQNWRAVFSDQATASIGDLAIAPSDPNTVWVGTGEANIFRSSMAGTGIYKSTDGGETFEHLGLTDTQHIARIVIHPKNADIVYVAAAGSEYTPNEERGVYKTIDGGKTWERVFHKNAETAVIDLAMDPKHPSILYAGTAPRRRYRWNDPLGGPETGVYKTTDGGRHWRPLTAGLPDFATGEYERVGIDVCAGQPETVYVLLNHDRDPVGKGGAEIFRSDDFGESFHLVEGNDGVRSTHPDYGWFFGQVRVDPNDAETVYCLGLSTRVSNDGGYTWRGIRGNHADYHGMWINPEDSSHVLLINDGGVMVSHDALETYQHPTNLEIAHGYNCGISQEKGKFWIYICTQDTGGWRGLVDLSRGRDAILHQPWESATGDEAGRQVVDPTNPHLVYSVSRYGGGPTMTDYSEKIETERRGRIRKSYRQARIGIDWKEQGLAGSAKRAQWVAPLILSPQDPKRLLFGAQCVFLSDDGGESWQRISPDLTNYDPDKQGNIAHAVIFAIAESAVEKGVIYAGTDDGNIQVTRDNGATWTEVSAGLPTGRCVASLEASHFVPGTVFAAVNGKRHDDFECYLFRSTDYGAHWESITANIPGSSANVIKQDPAHENLLFAGTDRAVYVTTDGAQTWSVLGKGLPTVYVHDLAIQTAEDYLVISTHGRGCYVLDIRDLRRPAEPDPVLTEAAAPASASGE